MSVTEILVRGVNEVTAGNGGCGYVSDFGANIFYYIENNVVEKLGDAFHKYFFRFVIGLTRKNFLNLVVTGDESYRCVVAEAEKILSDTAANVYIQDLADFVVLNPAFTGYEFYPLYAVDFSKIHPAA
jgi:hypothetical protein